MVKRRTSIPMPKKALDGTTAAPISHKPATEELTPAQAAFIDGKPLRQTKKQITIGVYENDLQQIDAAAKAASLSRASFLTFVALKYIAEQKNQ